VSERRELVRFLTALDEAARAGVARRCGLPAALDAAALDAAALTSALLTPDATVAALLGLDAFALQLLEGTLALGTDMVSRAQLSSLADGRATPEQIEQALGRLRSCALVTPAGPDVRPAQRVLAVLPNPAALGPPAAELLPRSTLALLDPVARSAGEEPRRPKAALVEQVGRLLADSDRLAGLFAHAPPDALAALDVVQRAPQPLRHPGTAPVGSPLRWLLDRGLLIADTSRYELAVPREVGLASRGGRVLATLEPTPPGTSRPVAADLTGSSGAGEAGLLLADVSAVLQWMGTAPPPALKSGGLGVRELRRLAGTLGLAQERARLAVALLDHAGLVAEWDGSVLPTQAADAWQAAAPAEQWQALAVGWLGATAPLVADGEALLLPPYRSRRGPVAAPELLRALATVEGSCALSRPDLVDRVLWCNPLRLVPGAELPAGVDAVLAEAGALGVSVAGALTEAGRRLAGGDEAAAAAALAPGLPTRTARALVGSDLTVVVPGPPAAALAALLDATADRESRGAGATWRLSPASVRRALDGGTGAEELLAGLREAAGQELPGTVVRLIDDVARRHGEVEVGGASTWLRVRTPALAAEVAVDRRLSALGLTALGDRLLASAAAPGPVLAALRRAGYLPTAAAGSAPEAASRARRAPGPAPGRAGSGPGPGSVRDGGVGGCSCPSCRSTRSPHVAAASRFAAAIDGRPDADYVGPGWQAGDDWSDEDDLGPGWPAGVGGDGGDGGYGGYDGDDGDEPDGDEPDVSTGGAVVLPFQRPDDEALLHHAGHLPAGDRTSLLAAVRTGTSVQVDYLDGRGRRTTRRLRDLVLDPPNLVAWCDLRDDERTFALRNLRSVRA